ncbi:MAG: amidohydrolase family protein, partial [Acidimicrobiales bacterium]
MATGDTTAGTTGATLRALEEMPLVDHHAHGVVTAPLDRVGFELLISESGVGPPGRTSHFDSPLGMAVRAHCAPLLGLDRHAGADEYIDARAA